MQSIIQHRIRDYRQYLSHSKKMLSQQEKIFEIEQEIATSLGNSSVFTGFSTTAGKTVDFILNRSVEGTINWREGLICPETNLSNRLRRSYDTFIQEACPYQQDNIYITEQVTPFYKYLANKFPNLIGSEYLGDKCEFGRTFDDVRNETMDNLSFSNDTFDHVLSFECLEHIPNFTTALEETYRVLRKNGKFVFSVPFLHQSYPNLIRATVNENHDIHHILPPEYHGDPLDSEGILCFTHFGWELLDILRDDIGFSDAYGLLSWSSDLGYLGLLSIVFVATK